VNERKLINEPPQNFGQVAAVNQDAKELLAAHATLHQWAKEITSASPVVEIGQHRWTLQYIIAAHDVVVRRMTQIKPKWQHDSPMTSPVAASKTPIMLQMGAVSIAAIGENELSVAAESQVIAAGAMAQIRQAFPGKVINQSSVGSANSEVYHLVLVSASAWKEMGERKLGAAYDAFRAGLGSLFLSPRLRGSIVREVSQLRVKAAMAHTRLEAAEAGTLAAESVLQGNVRVVASSKPYRKAQMKAATDRILRLLGANADPRMLFRAESMITTALDLADAKGTPENREEAIDVAMDIARAVAKDLRKDT
jgi:hypothetical protein